jgi:hypothetical protein
LTTIVPSIRAAAPYATGSIITIEDGGPMLPQRAL